MVNYEQAISMKKIHKQESRAAILVGNTISTGNTMSHPKRQNPSIKFTWDTTPCNEYRRVQNNENAYR